VALEDVQGLHNRMIVNVGNLSASNDPKQIPNDAISQLAKGAEQLAAGKTLGLTGPQTLKIIEDNSRDRRRNAQRENYRNREQRRAIWEQSQKTLRNEGFEVDSPDTDLLSSMEVDPFGQDQGQYYEYSPEDRQYDQQQRERIQEDLLDAQDRGDKKAIRALSGELRLNPEDRPITAPQSAMKDALTQLQSGINAFGYDAFPGSRNAESALEDQLGSTRQLDSSVGRDLVIADRQNYSPLQSAYNDVKAQIEAESLLRAGMDGSGDAALARIPELRDIGKATGQVETKVVTQNPIVGEAIRRMGVGTEARHLDPRDGTPLAIQGPELPTQMLHPAGTPNNMTSSGMLNAPISAKTWVEQTQPGYREGGRVFGDYPQTDITLATTNFANRLKALEGYGLEGVSQNIRSTDELQRVVDHVIKVAAQRGDKMYTFNPDSGKNQFTENPDVRAVMTKLRMSEPDQSALAGALAQLEMAKQQQVSQQSKDAYFTRSGGATPNVVFDAPEAINPQGGAARIARQPKGPSIRVGTGVGAKGQPVAIKQDIRTAMQGLSDPMAADTSIGAVAETRPATSSFRGDQIYNRTGETSPEGIERVLVEKALRNSRKTGKPVDVETTKSNIRNAQFVQERADRAARERANKEAEIMSALLPSDQRMRRSFRR